MRLISSGSVLPNSLNFGHDRGHAVNFQRTNTLFKTFHQNLETCRKVPAVNSERKISPKI